MYKYVLSIWCSFLAYLIIILDDKIILFFFTEVVLYKIFVVCIWEREKEIERGGGGKEGVSEREREREREILPEIRYLI